MVTVSKDLLPGMARDGFRVIFDQDLRSNSVSTKSCSGSGSECSDSGSGSRTRDSYRGRQRSSSNSSSSSLSGSTRPRSRSHPRCHRNSSRCRCTTHYKKDNGHRRHRSPSRRSRTDSRSCYPASSPVKSSRHRSDRHHHRSNSRQTSTALVSRDRLRVSKSPSKSYRSRSRSSRRSTTSPTLDEKKVLLRAVKEDATKVLRVDLPESMSPIQDESYEDCPTPEPQAWVRPEAVPEKAPSQNSDAEPDDAQRSTVSPIRRGISFSIHNSIAKPTVAPVTAAKATARVDGIESRKPYGHWVPIRQGVRPHKRTTSR